MYVERISDNGNSDTMHHEIHRCDRHGGVSAHGRIQPVAMRRAHASVASGEQYSFKKAALTSFTWGRFSLSAKR
jgi:hypothetical protein